MSIALQTLPPLCPTACIVLAPPPEGPPPVRLYGEADLEPTDTPLPPGAPGALRALVEAGTDHEREDLVRQALSQLGFEWMGCASLRLERGEWRPQTVMTTYAPPTWARCYGRVHQELASHVQPLLRSCLPLIWDLRDLADSPARCVQGLADSGVHSGISLRLAVDGAHSAEEFALISLMSSRTDRSWIDDQRLGRALTFILCLHEFLSRHARPPRIDGAPQGALSALQQRILQCLAQGRSDKEIAGALKLSSHAVDYHLRQLRRRFRVRNRVQLVSAAARSH